jgi:predicted membrane protein
VRSKASRRQPTGRLGIGQRIAPFRFEEHQKMPLLNLVVVLIVVGVVLYLINRFIPMASSIKTILNIVVVIAVCVWVLQAVGLWANVTNFRITR